MTYEPHATAVGLCAMLEGLWLRLMMGTEDVTAESAHHAALRISCLGLSETVLARRRSAPPRSHDRSITKKGNTMTSITRRLGADHRPRRRPVGLGLRNCDGRGQGPDRLRLVRLRGPGIPSGLCRQERRFADLHLLRRRGRGLPEDALRLQDRPRASLLAERGEMARGRAAAAARHVEDRGLERSQSRHHGDEGSGDDRRRHGLVHAVGLGQHAPHLQFREDRREGRRSR